METTGLQIELGPNEAELWRCSVLVLDLAVLSYVSAHVTRFDKHDFEEISITRSMHRGVPQDSTPGLLTLDCGIRLSCQHHLRCLDPFLGHQPVWVFQNGVVQPSSLYLSTDIETFSDIWGPLWKVSFKTEPQNTIQYNVGGGAIKRSQVERGNTAPSLRPKEVFCHWEPAISSTSTDRQLPEGANIIEGGFEDHDILLIGGSSSRLVSNPHCRSDSRKISKSFMTPGVYYIPEPQNLAESKTQRLFKSK